MPLVTCGLSDEGVIAAEVQFSTSHELIPFEDDMVSFDFRLEEKLKEFDTDIQIVNFDVDIIRVEECYINY